jgi:hypothetical protein
MERTLLTRVGMEKTQRLSEISSDTISIKTQTKSSLKMIHI